jgi:hypothetical protein
LGNIPRCAAVSLAVKRTVVCPPGMLNRRMKPDVRDVYSGSKRDAERLNRAIEVLVIECILIVPDASSRVRNFVTHKPDAIVAWVGFELVYRRASPSCNGGLLPHGGTYTGKTKGLIDSGYVIPTVRSVVVHVALARMTLAPGVFVRHDVLRFGKIRRSWV